MQKVLFTFLLFPLLLLAHYVRGVTYGYSPEGFILEKLLKPNFIVFDVGANVGNWSKMAFDICPEVHLFAFEPIPEIFLKDLNRKFHDKKFKCYNIGFSNINSPSEGFYYYRDYSEASGLYYRGAVAAPVEPTVINIELETLDNFCRQNGIEHIDFLKIDTEGNEKNVLVGAHRMLSEHRVSYCQFEYGGTYTDAKITLKEIYTYLRSLGYKLYKMSPRALVPMDQWESGYENYQSGDIFVSLDNIPDLNY